MGLTRTTDKAVALHPVQPRAYARDLQGLLQQLQSEDGNERRWAARDLAAHPEATAALCACLRDEADASVRAAVLTSLAGIGSVDVCRGLLPLLRSEDAALRNDAIEVLAGMPDAVAPSIEALLADEDSDVRIFALNLLGDLRHPFVPQWLEGVMHHEASVNVVGAALEVAIEVGSMAMRPVLQSVRERFATEPFIVFAADMALERIEAA